MIEENDFDDILVYFFSIFSVGVVGLVIKGKSDKLKDVNFFSVFVEMDIIIIC